MRLRKSASKIATVPFNMEKICKLLNFDFLRNNYYWRAVMKETMDQKDIDIFNLFMQNEDTIKHMIKFIFKPGNIHFVEKLRTQFKATLLYLIRYIFKPENVEIAKELVTCLISCDIDTHLVRCIFWELVWIKNYPESLELEIFKLLLDKLPINDFVNAEDKSYYLRLTPLNLSIKSNKFNLVSLLLEQGANIHRKTSFGDTPLVFASFNLCDASIIQLLLKNGANINEKVAYKMTALHEACECTLSNLHPELYQYRSNNIPLLLENGADLNILNYHGQTPVMVADSRFKEFLVEEIAKLKFDSKFICNENLNYIREDEDLQKYFDDCLAELNKMKNHTVYNNLTLYDVYQMRKKPKKLIALSKNKDFVETFELVECWDYDTFAIYGPYIYYDFEDALQRRDTLDLEEKKLYSIFKNYLPSLVIKKISDYVNEHLFFDLKFFTIERSSEDSE